MRRPAWLTRDEPVPAVVVAGLCCLAAATALHGFITPALQEAGIDAQRSAQAVLADRERQALRAREAKPDTRQGALSGLPPIDQENERLAELLSTAAGNGLSAGTVELPPATANAPGVRLLTMTQSLRGPYLAVRHSVQAALAEDPALALDQIRMTRQQADAADFDIEWTWVLHSRAVAGGSPP